VAARLGPGFQVDASWIPPVRVNGVKSNLLGLALAWNGTISSKLTLGARAHTTLGEVNAPITCPEESLDNPDSECFEGTESDDSYKPNIFGADVRLGLGTGESKVRPYAGLGYNRLQPRFQVNFTNSAGELDDRKVSVDMNRLAIFGGLSWNLGESLGLAGEVYSTPADAVTFRVAFGGTF
jgi:hypothetical protein